MARLSRLTADKDIFRHREVGENGRVLMNNSDALTPRFLDDLRTSYDQFLFVVQQAILRTKSKQLNKQELELAAAVLVAKLSGAAINRRITKVRDNDQQTISQNQTRGRNNS